MEELVEFTLILKQLDDNELIQFLSESLKNHGHSLFGKLFFNYFNNHHHRTEIKTHTQCLMDIINAREDKPNKITFHHDIDRLPSALISECASYLPLSDYALFSRSNRRIFVSTNKPFKLYELPHSAFHKCSPTTNMHKFKSVQSISIDISHFNQNISNTNQSIWKHCSFNTVELSNHGKNEGQAISFFDKNIINFNKIHKLELSNFGSPSVDYNTAVFCRRLDFLKDIKHLSFREVYLSRFPFEIYKDSIHAAISKAFPNLKSFSVADGSNTTIDLATRIVNTIGHQLESLTFPAEHASELCCNFSSLKELEFGYCGSSNPTCLPPFEHVTTLQSMSIASDNELMLKSCIAFMLKKQTSIKQMKIVSDIKYLKCIAEQIQMALFDSHYQGVQRDSLFIFIECSDGLPSEIVPAFEVFKLLNTLKNVRINDFMIRINLNGTIEDGKIKKLASEFDKMKDDYLVYCYGNVFTVGHKNCKINGLRWRRLFQ
eukprot:194716_1